MHCPPQSAETREFVFTPVDFERIRALIRERAGICLSPTKHEMVYSRLARRLRARGVSRFSEYVALLDGRDPEEWQAFVNALTTNLTSFFRESHHFSELAAHVEALRRQRDPYVSVWCCAASTGEEPYSIAMTLIDAFRSYTPPVSIIATDVDTNVLATAEAGTYPAERVAKLSDDQVRRFFLRSGGADADPVMVRPEVRRLVKFRQVNLLDPQWPVRGPFDAIFCRNVMIYFDKPTQRSVAERLAPLLHPGGLLFAGHSESLVHSAHVLRLRGNTVYERARAAA
jgi:chemotaxis protein methyltransferase CheR